MQIYLIFLCKSKGQGFRAFVAWFQMSKLLTSCFFAVSLASLLKAISCSKTELLFQPSRLSSASRKEEGWVESHLHFFKDTSWELHLTFSLTFCRSELKGIETPFFHGVWEMRSLFWTAGYAIKNDGHCYYKRSESGFWRTTCCMCSVDAYSYLFSSVLCFLNFHMYLVVLLSYKPCGFILLLWFYFMACFTLCLTIHTIDVISIKVQLKHF